MSKPFTVSPAQVKKALEKRDGNICAAARDLGVTRVTVYRRVSENTDLRYALGRQRFDRVMQS